MTMSKTTKTYCTLMPTPLGELQIVVDEHDRLLYIGLPGHHRKLPSALSNARRCAYVVQQLREYFAGLRTKFELTVTLSGTDFQRRAWRVLQMIPFGKTFYYQEQAFRAGNPRAMRAVGGANGKNPIPIVVPCHRVIGKHGALTGFGGGLAAKRWLLQHETRVLTERSDRR
ncbi:methylated-DNA--protein-cysteine methyltransferase [Planctomycetota bacterium]|nr:methylated-DNA--protein-cysteine methyltransferase [Planctomycetota bacterium]